MATNPINRGNQAFLDEDYRTAISAYDEAIALEGQDEATARSNRAATYIKLNKYREALQDASASVKNRPTEIAYYRKGLASFALEEFETALEAFRQGQQMAISAAGEGELNAADDPRKYRTWIRKCEAEMEAEDEEKDVAVIGNPVVPAADGKSNGLGASVGGEASRAVAPMVGTERAPVSSAPVHLRTKFQYYQSYDKVTVAVLEKGLKEAEVEVDVEPRRLTVRRKADMSLLFDKVLYEEVLPEKKRTRFMASKLEVTLTKKSPADWPELEGKGGTPTGAGSSKSTAAVALKSGDVAPLKEPPTKIARPYSSNKNWDVVEKEIKKELDADKPEGEEALNHLFKSIYGNADEDTRRAMVKSMQTSGGTVLSTNWDEVGKANYEKDRQAPKGMEWRTWEGQKLPQKDDDDN